MEDPDLAPEPIPGLPKTLPPGERILWQGRPDTARLAREALKIRWVAGWFALLFAYRWSILSLEMHPLRALLDASLALVLGAVACGILWAVARAQARATMYTITNRRVAMRIGAALSMTIQFPFKWIESAGVALARDGTGTIALRTGGETRFAALVLWPHMRPWRLRRTEPALRCIPDAAAVARLLAEALAAERDMPRVARISEPASAPRPVGAAVPAE